MHIPLLLMLGLGCTDGKTDGEDTSGDGGGTDGGGTDGGSPDGGATVPDECDGRPSERFCDEDGWDVICDDRGDVSSREECAAETLCTDGAGCLPCGLSWDAGLGPVASRAALVRLSPTSADFSNQRFSMRPLRLSALDPAVEGEVVVEADSAAIAVWTTAGEPVSFPLRVSTADLPLDLLVQGLERFEGPALRASVEGCDAASADLELRVEPWVGLAGRALDGFPWLERVSAFADGERPEAGLDPWLTGDLLGREGRLYRVARRSAEEWVADPTLVEAGDDPLSVTVADAGIAGNTWELTEGSGWVESDVLATAWDLVLDLDGDGMLSPGDLFQGPTEAEPAFWSLTDLTEAGPYDVTSGNESGGSWLGQRIYFPTDIASLVDLDGPRPLVVMSHGNGHDYEWYDYLGEHLASWGFVFMAHQNNTGPGIETASTTTLTNTDWFLENVDTIADGALAGMVDGSRIAWLGHSRGGEGVTRAYDRLVRGAYVPEFYDADDILFISSIAPTVFLGVGQSNPHDRFYHQIDAAADGDVTGGASSGVVQYLRLAEVSTGPLSVHYVQGAAHNDFNCCGFDDGDGPVLIGRTLAQGMAMSTYLGILNWVLLDEPATADLVRRTYSSFRDGGIDDRVLVASQYRVDPAADRLVLDDFQTEESVSVSSAGTAVEMTVTDVVESRFDDANTDFTYSESDPMNGMTLAEDADDLSRGVVFSWSDGSESSFRVDLPEGDNDLREWTWLSLRAAQSTRHPNTVALGGTLTFAVTLIDRAGGESTILMEDAGQSITEPYQRRGSGSGAGWANEWNTVRLRVADFAAEGAGIDLSDVVAVELRFGKMWGSAQGRIGLDDLQFSKE